MLQYQIFRIHQITQIIPAVSLIVLINFFAVTLWAIEKPYIISGFDDVLRQAENTGLVKAALKILEPDKTFSGMPELYTIISKQEAQPKFTLISGISSWFDGRIEGFLSSSRFPTHRRYLRNWLTQWFIEDFKISTMNAVISALPHRKFIVIFDNSDASLALASKLHQQFPNRIHAIYLRHVVEKDIPAAAIYFFTAFDIAISEFKAGRMNTNEVEIIGNAVLNENDASMLFPAYSLCPRNYTICQTATASVLAICENVQAHVRSLCQKR